MGGEHRKESAGGTDKHSKKFQSEGIIRYVNRNKILHNTFLFIPLILPGLYIGVSCYNVPFLHTLTCLIFDEDFLKVLYKQIANIRTR